jgi:hypothetical protein
LGPAAQILPAHTSGELYFLFLWFAGRHEIGIAAAIYPIRKDLHVLDTNILLVAIIYGGGELIPGDFIYFVFLLLIIIILVNTWVNIRTPKDPPSQYSFLRLV